MGSLKLGGTLCFGSGMPCVVMVLVVLPAPFILGISGYLLICTFFISGCFDAMDLLNDFAKQVVVSRRDSGVRKWTRWLREDLGARPYVWLRLTSFLLLPFW